MVEYASPFGVLFNFRDAGGHALPGGGSVRRGRLYRADSLHRLTAEDHEAFAALGVRTVIDLRRPREVARDGRVPEFPGLGYWHIHPEHREWDETPYEEQHGHARYLADRYLDLTEEGAAGLADVVKLIADPVAAPVLVHCVAGKDRTGVVCALTLGALGVPDEAIATDYALSTEGSARFTAWVKQAVPDQHDLPAAYLAAPAEAMLLFLADLRARYGSVTRYLHHAGLTEADLATLRAHLIAP